MTVRVRALLITPDGGVLTLRRELPGGEVDKTDSCLEDALCRVLMEELGAEPEIIGLLTVVNAATEPTYIYLAEIDSWPHHDAIDIFPRTAAGLRWANLKPASIAELLIQLLKL